MAGRLTVRDRTSRYPSRPGCPFRAAEVWLDAEIKVNRADFGLTWNQLGMASMDNVITVHAIFTGRNRQPQEWGAGRSSPRSSTTGTNSSR